MLPERIQTDCGIPNRWKLDPTLWRMLLSLDASVSLDFQERDIPYPGLWILSGHRTPQENANVGGVSGSRHLNCPSTAADLRFGSVAGVSAPAILALLGANWKWFGGRWGGDFGDENHFDLG